jgi:uncharacterized protein (TIGR02996 family)
MRIPWEPDIRITPCLGCDDWIQPEDLVRHHDYYAASGASWHPYHFWCCRTPPPAVARLDRCADCGARIPDADRRSMVQWAATYPARLGPDRGERVPRPAGWCIVAVTETAEWRRTRSESDRRRENRLQRAYEIVHAECPGDSMRSFADSDERMVYGDWLEQRGELDRAQFVRIVDRSGTDVELRQLRARLPSSWCRRVLQTCRAEP